MKRPLFSLVMLMATLMPGFGLADIPFDSHQVEFGWARVQPDVRHIERLVRLLAGESVSLYISRNDLLGAGDVPAALEWIKTYQNVSSFPVLMLLRQHHPEAYASVSPYTKARILIAHLGNVKYADDWSHMSEGGLIPVLLARGRPPQPACVDHEAAQALLELLSQVAIPLLVDVLQDEEEIRWSGSAESTQSYLDQLRKCDLAYRYICLLKGIEPQYFRSVKHRDQAIAALMQSLGVRPKRPFEGRKYKERSIFSFEK
jgi:hypothetical protein